MTDTDGKDSGILKGSLFKNAAYLVMNGGISSVFGFLAMLMASRYFTKAELGLGATLVSLITLLGFISGLGLNIGLIHYLPKTKDRNALINSSFLVSGISAGAVASVTLLILYVTEATTLDILVGPVAMLSFIVFTIVFTVSAVLNNVFVSNRESRFVFFKDSLVFGGGRVLLLGILIYLAFEGAWSYYFSWGFAMLVGIIIGFSFFLKRTEKGYRLEHFTNFKTISTMARFSLGNYVAGLLNMIPALLFPLMITEYLTPESTADYIIPWTIIAMLLMAVNALNTALFAEGSSDRKSLPKTLKHGFQLTMVLLIPAIIGLYVFSQWALALFGQAYVQNSNSILRMYLLSVIPVAITTLYLTVEKVRGRVRWIIIAYAVSGGGSTVLGLVFLIRYGLIGIPTAWLICQSAVAIVAGISLLRFKDDG